MTLTLLVIGIATICAIVVTWAQRSKSQSELDRHSISVEQLQSMMVSGQELLLFDVRQPLDVLAYPELIPGAKRIPPEEVLKTPSRLPRDEDIVVYCTCPGDKTSRSVLRRALAGLPESSSSQEDWRLGKRRGILWNPIENPFGFRFQPGIGHQDKHFCGCPGPSLFARSYPQSKASRSRLRFVLLVDTQPDPGSLGEYPFV